MNYENTRDFGGHLMRTWALGLESFCVLSYLFPVPRDSCTKFYSTGSMLEVGIRTMVGCDRSTGSSRLKLLECFAVQYGVWYLVLGVNVVMLFPISLILYTTNILVLQY